MQKGKVECNGQKLYWESHGKGTPLVLVMGIGYDATLWGFHQVPFFSEYFQTIVFDNRDVGRSSQATKAYTTAVMADDIAGLLDGLGVERTHMLGISMGGMICQEFAKISYAVLTPGNDQAFPFPSPLPCSRRGEGSRGEGRSIGTATSTAAG